MNGCYFSRSGLNDWELAGQQQKEKLSFSDMHLLIGLLSSASVLVDELIFACMWILRRTELDWTSQKVRNLQFLAEKCTLFTLLFYRITTPERPLWPARPGSSDWRGVAELALPLEVETMNDIADSKHFVQFNSKICRRWPHSSFTFLIFEGWSHHRSYCCDVCYWFCLQFSCMFSAKLGL